MTAFKQSLVMLFALLIVFAIVNTPLTSYIAPILGAVILLALIFILIKNRKIRKLPKDSRPELFIGSYKEVSTILISILLIIFLTGGITSPLFFLTYFLIFGITFMFEPVTVFIFMVGLCLLFIPDALQNDIVGNFVRVASLVFLAPISFFFGLEYKKRERLEKKIQEKANQIIDDARDLLKNEKMSETEQEKANEIIEEARELKKEAE